jgi:hypothetical protein
MNLLRPINDEEVRVDIDRRCQGYGNGQRTANELGLNPSHLREIKSGGRAVSRKIAAALGWELRWVKRKGAGM